MHNKLLVLSDRDKFFNSLYKEFKSDIMVKAENIHFKFKEMFGEKYILESDFIQGTSFSDFEAVKTIAYFNEESIEKTYRRLELLSDSGICEFFGKKSIDLQDNTMHNMKHAADDKTYFYYYHIPEYCQLKTDDGLKIESREFDADDLRFAKSTLEECLYSFCEFITLIDYMYDKLKS